VPIEVTWSASTDNVGVAKYLVTRDGGYTAGYSTTTSYSDATADKSTCTKYCHTYVIYALDAAGNKSTASAQALGLVADTSAPTAPTNVTAAATTYNKVSLTWAASTDNIGVAGYYVLRNGTTLGTTTTTAYTDSTAAPSTKYSYQILAYDAAGNTTGSATVSVSTPVVPDASAPSIPSSATATAVNSTQVNISWAPSTDNVGVSVYKVYRNGAQVGSVSIGTSFGDYGLTAGTTYSYTVVACDGAGNCSAQSSAASATTYSAVVTVVAGSMQGVVKNQSGTLLPKIRVTASNGVNSFTTYTGTQGNYALFNLTPATYTVKYSSRKYQTALSTVSVGSGATVTNNVTLVAR
jgi:chitodextrinase